jgi:hypothetical protein
MKGLLVWYAPTILYALDLTTKATSASNKGFGLANSMFLRSSGLKNTAALGKKATSSVSILPRLTPQQALNSGLLAGVAIFGSRATQETIDIIQEYRKHDEDVKIPGFRPERAEPTILVTPAADLVSSSSWYPATVDKGSIYPGAAPEVQKPIIFSGGIDYSEFNRPTLLFSKQQDSSDGNRHGGGKNAPHANKDARNSAKEKYEAAKKEYESLKKLYKTDEIIKQRDTAKRQMEHWKRKMDFGGESHSQKPKGGNR